MKYLTTLIVSFSVLLSTCIQSKESQKQNVGGPCEGCEAIYEHKDSLKSSDTIDGFLTLPNPIRISGTVFQNDGKTPAKDVILYVYHTNHKGIYPTRSSSEGWENRHGYLRTWLKTDANGHYEFFTSRPASYPNSAVPQHIHMTVKEPDTNAYYIEDFYFSDDPNLTSNILNRAAPRGGSGVITLSDNESIKSATRDIILGFNIPNY